MSKAQKTNKQSLRIAVDEQLHPIEPGIWFHSNPPPPMFEPMEQVAIKTVLDELKPFSDATVVHLDEPQDVARDTVEMSNHDMMAQTLVHAEPPIMEEKTVAEPLPESDVVAEGLAPQERPAKKLSQTMIGFAVPQEEMEKLKAQLDQQTGVKSTYPQAQEAFDFDKVITEDIPLDAIMKEAQEYNSSKVTQDSNSIEAVQSDEAGVVDADAIEVKVEGVRDGSLEAVSATKEREDQTQELLHEDIWVEDFNPPTPLPRVLSQPPALAPLPVQKPPAVLPKESPKEIPSVKPQPKSELPLKKQWWMEIFNDGYVKALPESPKKYIKKQCDFIETSFGLKKGSRILDLGCGVGHHAIELARRGYKVVGLDYSEAMLARAKENQSDAWDDGFLGTVQFLVGDMREHEDGEGFDGILLWGTTFGYFDEESNRKFLEKIHRNLKPGGVLMIDVVNRDHLLLQQPNMIWFEGEGCVVMEESNYNYITSKLSVKRNMMLDTGQQKDVSYNIRLYSFHELGLLLHQIGFRVAEVSGDEATPGVYFGVHSRRMLILCEKRAASRSKPSLPPTPVASS